MVCFHSWSYERTALPHTHSQTIPTTWTGTYLPSLCQLSLSPPPSILLLSPGSFPSVNKPAFRSSTFIKTLASYAPSALMHFSVSFTAKLPERSINTVFSSISPALFQAFWSLASHFIDTTLVKPANDLPNDQFSLCLHAVLDIVNFSFFLKHFLLLASITLDFPPASLPASSLSPLLGPIFLTSTCWCSPGRSA